MPETRAARVAELFKAALDREGTKRATFLASICDRDPDLHAEVASLLAHHDGSSRFLEQTASDFSASDLFAGNTLTPGEQVQQFRIESLIGTGGMGEVYLATDTQLNRSVALKMVQRGMGSREMVRRFRQEEKILAGLNHPNIAQLYGTGMTADGVPFFAMEYVAGKPLDEFVRLENCPLPERLALFRKVCAAVAYAHQHLIIHRDLKPANIRVTSDGEPKLLDFGIAKLLEPTAADAFAPTISMQAIMTPEYASPEQLRGETMTTRSDVYSLGVVLYELLTGTKPYRLTSRQPAEMARAILEQPPARPSAAISDQRRAGTTPRSLRGDLDKIVLMALRKEPERRYASAAALSDDIRRYLEGLPVRAQKDTLPYRASKFIQRHTAGALALLLLALAIIAGLIGTTWQARLAARERDQARQEKARAEQVNKFLQDILGAAAPEQRGRDAKVIDVLQDAAARVETELVGQPEVKAQALLTIGTTYYDLGLTQEAEKTLREALRLNRELHGEMSPTVAEAMTYLAGVLVNVGRRAEAETLVTKAVEINRALAQTQSKGQAFALFTLGEIYVRKAAYAQAQPLLLESVAISEKLGSNDDAAYTMVSLGRAQQFSGDLRAAEATYRRSIALFKQLPPRFELKLAMVFLNLGNLLASKGSYDEALQVLADAEVIFAKQGEATLYLVWLQNHLGRIYLARGDDIKAAEAAGRAIDIGRKVDCTHTVPFAQSLGQLGTALTRLGRAEEGEKHLREQLEIVGEIAPNDAASFAAAEVSLGECLIAQKRFEEAEPVLTAALSSLREVAGEDDARAQQARKTLAQLYAAWARPERAAP
jgi:serine/threonine-protein kinase